MRALGRENVLSAPSELAVYDCDAFTIERRRPDGGRLSPLDASRWPRWSKLCQRHGAPVVARGAGTSLAGGCLPLAAARVVVMLTRMNKVLEIDLRNRMAVVEAGVPNLRLTQALAGTGYHFAPDPSSQGRQHHRRQRGHQRRRPAHAQVRRDRQPRARRGGRARATARSCNSDPSSSPPGSDLIGVLVGSEGTLAIVTKVWVRLTPNPQDHRAMRAIFDSRGRRQPTPSARSSRPASFPRPWN